MPVYLWTAAAVLFYAANVPVSFAFSLALGEENRLKVGIGAFAARPVWRWSAALSPEAAAGWIERARTRGPRPNWNWRAAALYALRRIAVDGARVYLKLGTEDAAQTALICGAAQAVVYSAEAAGHFALRARIEPVFDRRALAFEAKGILSLRIGHIIGAMSLLGIDTVRRKLKNGKASN